MKTVEGQPFLSFVQTWSQLKASDKPMQCGFSLGGFAQASGFMQAGLNHLLAHGLIRLRNHWQLKLPIVFKSWTGTAKFGAV